MQNQKEKSALLVMDLQNAIVSRFENQLEVLRPLQNAVEAARRNDIPVIFVRVAFSEGYPEIGPRNKTFSRISQFGGMTVTDEGTQIHELFQPQPGEPIVTKYRVSAFTGSTLEVVLRSHGIDRLILTGISTSGVVLSTLREAADRDYALTVLSDACLDPEQEVHRVLVEKVFPRQADVLSVQDWVNTLESF